MSRNPSRGTAKAQPMRSSSASIINFADVNYLTPQDIRDATHDLANANPSRLILIEDEGLADRRVRWAIRRIGSTFRPTVSLKQP